jgi:hypothetical protein
MAGLKLREISLPGRGPARLALTLAAGLLAAGLAGCGGSAGGGGSANPGSVVATGALTGTFVPYAVPTASASQITWSNTVGDTVYTLYYSSSAAQVTGLTVTASGVVWNNGSTPAGYFPAPNNGGLFINMTSKVVTFSNAQITRNVSGSATATLNGSMTYQ